MKPRRYTAKFPPRLGDIVQTPDGYCGLLIFISEFGCTVYEDPHSAWYGSTAHLLLIHRPKKTMFIEEHRKQDDKE